MVPRKLMDEHYDESHAPMNCSLCKCTIERELWDLHTSIQCPQRMLACQYCQFELPAVDLLEHQDVCGNRTEFVNLAGSTSDFVNGLDMNSSSIRAQILLQNFQGKLLTDAYHVIQSSIKMASRLLLFITVHLVMFNHQNFFSNITI